jgi:beta-glucuronidase
MNLRPISSLLGGLALALAASLAAVVTLGDARAQAVATIDKLSPQLLLTNALNRPGIELSGTWTYSKDRYRVSFAEMNDSPPDPRNQRFRDINVEAEERANPNLFFEYDMQRAPRVDLPGSWNKPNTELRYYDGLMWYQRSFNAEATGDRRAFLRFEAVNYHAVVYLNGQRVGEHRGGFTPFTFEVTQLLRTGSNQITVGVDSVHTDEDIPPRFTDWDIYGGVTRPIRIVYTPRTYIDDSYIRLTDDGSISATVRLDGPAAAGQTVTLALPALNVRTQGRTNAQGVASWSFRAPSNLKRWSPEDPQLYDTQLSAAGDQLNDRMGFRTIKVVGENILLNGKPIFLRGISMHEEEFGLTPVRHITPQAARALLSEIKHGLGGNYVRLSHYPHAELTVRLADEMGLLVWSEIPVYWSINFSSEKALDTARRMMAENILRDRNRASVFVWSVGNETPQNAARTRFQSQLADDARALDPTRLVSAALWADKKMVNGRLEATILDPLAEKLDLLAINTYTGWYGDNTLDQIPQVRWINRHRKPLLLSEFGADAKVHYRDPVKKAKFSEDFQAEFYAKTIEMAEGISFLRGISPWILKDFQTPRREHPVYQNGWNRKGVVSESGERKLAFHVLAEYFRKKAAAEAAAATAGAPAR